MLIDLLKIPTILVTTEIIDNTKFINGIEIIEHTKIIISKYC